MNGRERCPHKMGVARGYVCPSRRSPSRMPIHLPNSLSRCGFCGQSVSQVVTDGTWSYPFTEHRFVILEEPW